MKKTYRDVSEVELFEILMDEKLKTPTKPQRKSNAGFRGRYISRSI